MTCTCRCNLGRWIPSEIGRTSTVRHVSCNESGETQSIARSWGLDPLRSAKVNKTWVAHDGSICQRAGLLRCRIEHDVVVLKLIACKHHLADPQRAVRALLRRLAAADAGWDCDHEYDAQALIELGKIQEIQHVTCAIGCSALRVLHTAVMSRRRRVSPWMSRKKSGFHPFVYMAFCTASTSGDVAKLD